jgi:NADPH-dependent 2,4-dienoyl-CoA reductase/sulfur reductase-like enzyme/ferredoxin
MTDRQLQVLVDLNRCQGYGQCCFSAPEVFKLHGEEGLEYDPAPDDSQRLPVMRAAKACPVQAISYVWSAGTDTGGRAIIQPGTEGAASLLPEVRRVVIVGASLAGLRAAEAARRAGFAGDLVVIGDEPFPPYDRPPLSKQALAGTLPIDHTPLAQFQDLRAQWLLGVAATGLDRSNRQIELSDGRRVDYDRLLIATGARARPWPDQTEGAMDGVFLLRGRNDCQRVRERLAAKPRRVLVVGGGVMGCEIAAVCRELGFAVTLTERSQSPLLRALGATVGSAVADLHRRHGVDLRTGVTVSALEGDGRGQVHRARLSDGNTLEVDLLVAALGVLRNVDWLQGAGLVASSRGVDCDPFCRALAADGAVAEGIYVAGDVARWPHPLYGGRMLSVEHWGNAIAQAEAAAGNMLVDEGRSKPYAALPTFWTSQYGINIKSVGLPEMAGEVMVTQGSLDNLRFAAVYGENGRTVAAVSFNQARWLPFYRQLVETAAPYPVKVTAPDAPAAVQSVPAGLPVAVA